MLDLLEDGFCIAEVAFDDTHALLLELLGAAGSLAACDCVDLEGLRGFGKQGGDEGTTLFACCACHDEATRCRHCDVARAYGITVCLVRIVGCWSSVALRLW